MLQLPLSESYMQTDKLKASMPLQHACWQSCQQRSLLHFSCFLPQHPPPSRSSENSTQRTNGTNWNVKAWQSGKCQGLPVLPSPSPSMSWQMAEGKHWCHAGRDHRTQCEIALKSAVKKNQFSFRVYRHSLLCYLTFFTGTDTGKNIPWTTYSIAGCSEMLTCALIFKSFWICWSQACLKLPMYNFPGSISTGYGWKLSSSCKGRSCGLTLEYICSFQLGELLNRSHVQKWGHIQSTARDTFKCNDSFNLLDFLKCWSIRWVYWE